MIIIPADGLAFLISAIIENLFALILSSIFSLKFIKVLFVLIVSEKYENYEQAYNYARDFIKSGAPYNHLLKIQNAWKHS